MGDRLIHMAERFEHTKGPGRFSLCGLNISFTGSIKQPLSFPYGSHAVTCPECIQKFKCRESKNRTLAYYFYQAGQGAI